MNFESGIKNIINTLNSDNSKLYPSIDLHTNKLIEKIDNCKEKTIELGNIKRSLISLRHDILIEKKNTREDLDYYKKVYLSLISSFYRNCNMEE